MTHGGAQQRIGRTVHTQETAVGIQFHVLFIDLAVDHREPRRRQRIDHFVGEHHAVPGRVDRRLQPLHLREYVRREPRIQPFPLTFAQIGTGLQDGVTRRHCLQRDQALDRGFRERAAAATDLHEHRVAAGLAEYRRQRIGHAFGEQRPQFRRRHEIAGSAEFGRACAVVTQPRRVQRQFHETPERKHTAIACDLVADQSRESLAVRTDLRIQIIVGQHAATPLRGRTG